MTRLALHLLPFLLILVHGPTWASPVLPLPINRLAAESEVIIHGTVTGLSVQRDPEGRIFTKVTLDIRDAWKGHPEARPFTIVHSGGILGNRWTATDGEVQFKLGEEVVVFLVLNSRGEGVTIGMNQGKFKVHRDEAGDQAFAYNLFHGSRPAKPGTQKGYRFPTQLPMSLESLKRRVTRQNL